MNPFIKRDKYTRKIKYISSILNEALWSLSILKFFLILSLNVFNFIGLVHELSRLSFWRTILRCFFFYIWVVHIFLLKFLNVRLIFFSLLFLLFWFLFFFQYFFIFLDGLNFPFRFRLYWLLFLVVVFIFLLIIFLLILVLILVWIFILVVIFLRRVVRCKMLIWIYN